MAMATLEQHKKWRDDLIYELRMHDVPGDRIGDILLEVESHIAETGETPEEAFGRTKDYAASRSASVERVDDEDDESSLGVLATALTSFAGTGLYVSGAIGLGKGGDSVFGINSWIALVVGIALIGYTLWTLPADLIRHPVTNAPLLGDGIIKLKAATAIGLVAIGIAFFFIGTLLAG